MSKVEFTVNRHFEIENQIKFEVCEIKRVSMDIYVRQSAWINKFTDMYR